MPSVQSSYSQTMRPAVEGMIANTEPTKLISRNVETVAGIGFGKVVQQGADADGCISDLNTSAMTAQTYLGITVRERSVRPETPNLFARYESARIMREGVIWVLAGAAVSPSDIVTVTLATGVIGKTAVGAGVVAIPNARWESTTSGAGLAKLRLSN